MKTLTLSLTVLILTFSAFGQKKPVRKKTVKPPTKTVELYEMPVVEKQTPEQRVIVEKTAGERVIGLFVGGDAKTIVVRTPEGDQTVMLEEIKTITPFVPGKLTVVGTDRPMSIPPDVDSAGGSGSDTFQNSISGGVLNGKATSLPKPEYPAAARAVRASGAVNVQVTIDEQGNVVSASAISGHPLLRQASEQSARLAKFSPITLSGQPVQVTGVIIYNFVP